MKKTKENLKQRAYLNMVTSFIDYGAKALRSFVVSPFIVNGLGGGLFGVWQMLGQITNYSNLADLKASTVLKWAVARDRESVSEEELRNYLTTTFFLVLFMMPLILIAASIIVWYLPEITGVKEKDITMVRITFVILIITFITNKFIGVLESLLQGMNLAFKRMGIRAAITVFSGGLSVVAILMGFGLIGLATVHFLATLLLGITLWVIIKKNVPWFGFSRFSIKTSKMFMKTSGWFIAWSGIQMVLTNSDKVLLGALASPIFVAQYVITTYLPNTIKDIVTQIIGNTLPGMGKLYGNKEFDKLLSVKRQVFVITWLFCCTIGSIGLIFNHSFVSLWIGEDQYADQFANLLLIFITIQYMFTYNDGILINISLNVKKKVYYGAVAALITILLSILLIEKMGIIGLCIALIGGRLIMSIAYPIIVAKILDHKINFDLKLFRMFLTMLAIFAGAYLIGENLVIHNWFLLIFFVSLSFLLVLLISYFVGVNKRERKIIYKQLNKIKFFTKKD